MQEESQRVPFGRQVRLVSGASKALRIGYADGDHHLWRETIDITAAPSGEDVIVSVRYLPRESTGNIHDRHVGRSRQWSLPTSDRPDVRRGE
jgi:hypothetical protein